MRVDGGAIFVDGIRFTIDAQQRFLIRAMSVDYVVRALFDSVFGDFHAFVNLVMSGECGRKSATRLQIAYVPLRRGAIRFLRFFEIVFFEPEVRVIDNRRFRQRHECFLVFDRRRRRHLNRVRRLGEHVIDAVDFEKRIGVISGLAAAIRFTRRIADCLERVHAQAGRVVDVRAPFADRFE